MSRPPGRGGTRPAAGHNGSREGAKPGDARDEALVQAITGAWIDEAVIGLGLCPFARPVREHGLLRIVVSPADGPEALLADLVHELRTLAAADPRKLETTLLVHPRALGDFLAFNDFLDIADAALAALGLEGELQIASFHPHYRFADAAPEDIANATNRSPFPALHLLREASIERAVAGLADPSSIYRRNRRTLEALGAEGWAALQERCRGAARRKPGRPGP